MRANMALRELTAVYRVIEPTSLVSGPQWGGGVRVCGAQETAEERTCVQGRRVIPSLSAGTWIHRSVPCKYLLGPGDTGQCVLVTEQTRSCSPGTVCAEDHT